MKCPVCNGQTKVLDVRTSDQYITTRKHECLECYTPFKTQEKIMFTSLPQHIRNHYLNTGRMEKR